MEKELTLSKELLERLQLDKISLTFDISGTGLSVTGQDGTYHIQAEKEHQLYRGLLVLANQLRTDEHTVAIKERLTYQDFGYMADASRNAVITVEASKRFIQHLALMGYSNYQLYMEDTYELEEQPYFGYFRGKYTVDELKEIEQEANAYGMDFIPCIQTLAHLSAFVKWNIKEVQELRDVDDILLIGSEPVYDLIDQMFKTLSHLKTRRVNIGMDEAHLVGLGRYLNLNGYQKRSLIMCQHLERVLDIADKYGFTCSMWSDMFFQLLSDTKNYEGELSIDDEVRDYLNALKSRVQLIYWDYYQLTEDSYTNKFNSHKQIADNIAFAGGAWKWTGFTPDNSFSLTIAPEAHAAAQKAGVTNVTVTGWGDNGGECSQFSVLPTLQAWAELAYTQGLESWDSHFETLFGLTAERFKAIDSANFPPSNPGGLNGINPNRYIFYQDVLCPLLDDHIDHDKDSHYFRQAAEQLALVASQAGEFAYLFETQELLCQILAEKASLPHELRLAYKADDKETLRTLLPRLTALKKLVKTFHLTYSRQWLAENKVFGLDTIDIRFGGAIARIERAQARVEDYLIGQIDRIDELEVAILPYNDFYPTAKATTANQWHLIATASTIYTT